MSKSIPITPIESKEQLLARLIRGSKINYKAGCYLWNPGELFKEYGRIKIILVNKTEFRIPTHRLSAYVFLNLDLTNNKIQVNHQRHCPNKNCWAPNHIYIGNQSENMIDSHITGRKPKRKDFRTHCPQGHEYTIENSGRNWNGIRYCKECKRIKNREFRLRRKTL